MALTNVDTSTLIHMGVELVVVGGLAFWTHRKTGDLQDQITALKEKCNTYEDVLKRQGELLAHHENVFRQMFGGSQGGQQQITQPPGDPKDDASSGSKKTTKKTKTSSEELGHSKPRRSVTPRKNVAKTYAKHAPESIEILTNEEPGENVDPLIAEELAELGVGTEDETCDVDGTCELKPGTKKK